MTAMVLLLLKEKNRDRIGNLGVLERKEKTLLNYIEIMVYFVLVVFS